MAPLENTGTGSASFIRRIASQLQSDTALPFCSFVRPWTVTILMGQGNAWGVWFAEVCSSAPHTTTAEWGGGGGMFAR